MDMKEMAGDPREYEAFVREIDESQYIAQRENMPRGIIPKRRGMSFAKSIAMEGSFPFPGFSPRFIASLSASSTAACTSGVVTVTAAAHGLPATTLDGINFYYPGSPSLAAGFYSGFSRTDANTATFNAQSSVDFGSESINGGAAFVDEVTLFSITLPANTLTTGNIISLRIGRFADAVASAKVAILKLGTTTISRSSSNSGHGTFNLSGFVPKPTLLVGMGGPDGTMFTSSYTSAINLAVPNTFNVVVQLAAAGMYVVYSAALLRIE